MARHHRLWRERIGPKTPDGAKLITPARVLVERELATTDYGSFFELSLDILCTAGFDGQFKDVNGAFGLTLGYGREELLAQPYIDLVHPDDRPGTVAVAADLANRARCGRIRKSLPTQRRYPSR